MEALPRPCQDLSLIFADLCRDAAKRVPELGHLVPERILFALSRSRAEGSHGLYARILPLRFAGGSAEWQRRRGRYQETWRLPPLHYRGEEILYLIQVLVPRFFRLCRREKLATLFHELYHISPACDGDLRRFPGRNYAHGHSRKAFQQRVDHLLDRYLTADPPAALLAPFDLTEEDWRSGRVAVSGLRVPLPRARLVRRERL
ncbi:hypothetical protein JCM30471_17850 [Desulfuromonas carbonis]|uniref:putative metallopeptidase n=1 Tax=Desulfuromonas sp. DDH964 TaxID=1823759 RepID=UPI00078B9036|nr:putative metallopeptidase [Desulfuromonas sp. DDH964]AMV73370.1 hypothetical protein DBW_3062 [Desulfuromonas sp. DDH964]